MTSTTITSCNRCGADVSNSSYSQLERRSGLKTVERIDLCVPCKEAFDRFMQPPPRATAPGVREPYRTSSVGEGT